MLALLGFSAVIVSGIVRPLWEATDAADQAVSGNLNVALDERGQDEVAHLQRTLNSMVQTLRGNMEDIRKGREAAEQQTELAHQAAEDAHAARRPNASNAGACLPPPRKLSRWWYSWMKVYALCRNR